MNTCQTCRWWSIANKTVFNAAGDEVILPFKRCQSPLIVDVSRDGFVHEKGIARSVPTNGAVYSDCEGHSASFYTGPDFGCIHHEEKP